MSDLFWSSLGAAVACFATSNNLVQTPLEQYMVVYCIAFSMAYLYTYLKKTLDIK